MRKNYRFEILTFLYKIAPAPVNLLPFIESKANENIFSGLYFKILLDSMRENGLIEYEDYGDEIIVQLLQKGIEEFERMKKYRTIII